MALNRILVPVEDRDLTHAVLKGVMPLISREDAEVILLNVVPPDLPDLATRAEVVSFARDSLQQLCDTLCADGLNATADWVAGDDPAASIIERAAELRASLIVQPTHVRSDLPRWTRGSRHSEQAIGGTP